MTGQDRPDTVQRVSDAECRAWIALCEDVAEFRTPEEAHLYAPDNRIINNLCLDLLGARAEVEQLRAELSKATAAAEADRAGQCPAYGETTRQALAAADKAEAAWQADRRRRHEPEGGVT